MHNLQAENACMNRKVIANIQNGFIAPGAVVPGDVHLEENVGIWYNATVRGDRAWSHYCLQLTDN